MTNKISRRNWLKTSALAGSVMAFSSIDLSAKPITTTNSSKKLVRLTSNENPYGFSPRAKQAIIDSVELGNQYAHREKVMELEKMIADREGLKPENVILGSGSGEVLCMTGAAYGWQQGELITPELTFPLIYRYAENFNAKINGVPLDSKLRLDLNEMGKRVSNKTSLVYVCNPNNPTGTYLPTKPVRDFCETFSKQTTVFVDEAYLEFTNDFPRNSMVELVKQNKNVIVSRTFSKIYGMAGMRVGYGLAKKEIADKLKKFRMTWFNALGINAAIESYKDTEFIKMSVKRNNKVRAMFSNELKKINMPHPKSEGNYLWVNGGKRIHNLYEKVKPYGLSVRNGRGKYEDWARITIGTQGHMKTLVKALKKL